MVGDEDEGAGGVCGVDAAGGVGDEEGAAAEKGEDAGGKAELSGGVALVGVHAALHDGDGCAGDGAEDEATGVADDGGLGEVGDCGVGDGGGGVDLGGEVAEAGTEDDPEARGCGVEGHG